MERDTIRAGKDAEDVTESNNLSRVITNWIKTIATNKESKHRFTCNEEDDYKFSNASHNHQTPLMLEKDFTLMLNHKTKPVTDNRGKKMIKKDFPQGVQKVV